MTPAEQTSYPAQIVFVEVDDVTGPRRWQGRLFRQSACVDTAGKRRRVTWCPRWDITEDPQTLRCAVRMNGGPTHHSARYTSFPDVTAAMKAGIRWAARRFRVPEETGYTVSDEAIDWLRAQSGGESAEAIEISRLMFVAYRAENSVERAAARAHLAKLVNERSRP